MAYEIVVVAALGGEIETNCYLFYCEASRACAIIDPGAEPGKIFAAVAALELKPALILDTHGHLDHIGANRDMKEKYGVPICLHSADASMLKAPDYVEMSLLLGGSAADARDRCRPKPLKKV